jgi:hypothetical protein
VQLALCCGAVALRWATALKARMGACKETINWSSVAFHAFEAKSTEITKQRGARNMKEVVMRLRASKRQSETVQYNEGFEAGKTWGMHRAEADELERLADLRDRNVTNWDVLFDQYDSNAFSVAEHMAFAILGEDDEPGRAEARDFWDAAIGEPIEKLAPAFVRGFVEGALEVWDEVADDL